MVQGSEIWDGGPEATYSFETLIFKCKSGSLKMRTNNSEIWRFLKVRPEKQKHNMNLSHKDWTSDCALNFLAAKTEKIRY